MASSPSEDAGSKSTIPQTNMDVDYVVVYKFSDTDKTAAIKKFEELIEALGSIGLATEVRNGENETLLVFVKVASEEHLHGEVYRSRIKDWMHGIRSSAPPKETLQSLDDEPLVESERLRIIYQLITQPNSEGGAGITPKENGWKEVEAIFPLHNHAYNKDWIKKWAKETFLEDEDFDEIRNRFGEKIAFYFAFTQWYFNFLLFIAGFGALSWLVFGYFSKVYALINVFWCVVFSEFWKHQEVDLGIRWGVRGVSKIERKRTDFKHEKEITDPVTGELVRSFSAKKRLQRQLLQVPFAIATAVVLGSLIATCFGIEIFISEVYNGPFKSVLVFLPTGILTVFMPILTGLFNKFAASLTEFENYETWDAHDRAMTEKIFIINFVTSYLPIFLTAFVYVPFGSIIVPYLDVFSLTVRPFSEHEGQLKTPEAGFTINPSRLRKQVIYFTVTAQIVNMALEVIVPYLKRRGLVKYQKYQNERAAKRGELVDVAAFDPPEEKEFLARVRAEATLDNYDVTTDLREMVMQFGYLSLFSVVWPLTPVSFLVNDWFELRADAVKICVEMRRPIPWRADSIGPWLDSLSFLTWMGTITTSALVYLFCNDGLGPEGVPYDITGWALLLSVFFAEHIFLVFRWGIKVAISKIDSPGRKKERRERFLLRKAVFEESLTSLNKEPTMGEAAEKLDRQSLEEDQRTMSLGKSRVEDKFWARQKGWKETVEIGRRLIEKAPVPPKRDEEKKEL